MAISTDLDSITRFLRGTGAPYRLGPRPVQDVLRLFRELLDSGLALMQARADGRISRYITAPPEVGDLVSICIAVFDSQLSAALSVGDETVSIGLALEPEMLEAVAGTIRGISRYYMVISETDPDFPVPSLDVLEMLEGIHDELHDMVSRAPVPSATV